MRIISAIWLFYKKLIVPAMVMSVFIGLFEITLIFFVYLHIHPGFVIK